MNLKKWVISCFVFLSILFASGLSYSQQCEYLDESEGGDRYIRIDGQTYFYITVEKSRQLLKDASKLSDKNAKIDLLEMQLSLSQEVIKTQDNTIGIQSNLITDLNEEIKFMADWQTEANKYKKSGFFESQAFSIIATTVVISGAYYIWNESED